MTTLSQAQVPLSPLPLDWPVYSVLLVQKQGETPEINHYETAENVLETSISVIYDSDTEDQ